MDMQIQLAFNRMFLAPGKAVAVPAVAGARVRVVDGLVWATTSNSPEDIWLGKGQEHTIRTPGRTVIESLGQATVELIPPAATGKPGRITSRYEMALPRVACNLAALAMTAVTIGLLVVLPAKIETGSPSPAPTPSVVATTPGEIVGGGRRNAPGATAQKIAQASAGAMPPTRVQ
jgi:hypothetical protein